MGNVIAERLLDTIEHTWRRLSLLWTWCNQRRWWICNSSIMNF